MQIITAIFARIFAALFPAVAAVLFAVAVISAAYAEWKSLELGNEMDGIAAYGAASEMVFVNVGGRKRGGVAKYECDPEDESEHVFFLFTYLNLAGGERPYHPRQV